MRNPCEHSMWGGQTGCTVRRSTYAYLTKWYTLNTNGPYIYTNTLHFRSLRFPPPHFPPFTLKHMILDIVLFEKTGSFGRDRILLGCLCCTGANILDLSGHERREYFTMAPPTNATKEFGGVNVIAPACNVALSFALQNYNFGEKSETMSAMYEILDADGNGKVSKDEVLDALKDNASARYIISICQHLAPLMDENTWRQTFDKIDLNGDGYISLIELQAYCIQFSKEGAALSAPLNSFDSIRDTFDEGESRGSRTDSDVAMFQNASFDNLLRGAAAEPMSPVGHSNRTERVDAVKKLQASARRMSAQRKFQGKRSSSKPVNSPNFKVQNRRKSGLKTMQLRRRSAAPPNREQAALRIQRQSRKRVATKRVGKVRERKSAAATSIQRRARSTAARRRVSKLRQEKRRRQGRDSDLSTTDPHTLKANQRSNELLAKQLEETRNAPEPKSAAEMVEFMTATRRRQSLVREDIRRDFSFNEKDRARGDCGSFEHKMDGSFEQEIDEIKQKFLTRAHTPGGGLRQTDRHIKPGLRIVVQWETTGGNEWCLGEVIECRDGGDPASGKSRTWCIKYDDGDVAWHDLTITHFSLFDPSAKAAALDSDIADMRPAQKKSLLHSIFSLRRAGGGFADIFVSVYDAERDEFVVMHPDGKREKRSLKGSGVRVKTYGDVFQVSAAETESRSTTNDGGSTSSPPGASGALVEAMAPSHNNPSSGRKRASEMMAAMLKKDEKARSSRSLFASSKKVNQRATPTLPSVFSHESSSDEDDDQPLNIPITYEEDSGRIMSSGVKNFRSSTESSNSAEDDSDGSELEGMTFFKRIRFVELTLWWWFS